jgi:PAS domain S-box-containing protein
MRWQDLRVGWGASSQWRNSAAQFVLGAGGAAALTYLGFRLAFDPAVVGFSYLVLIALLSLMGSFAASIVLSVIAVGCLDYFFTEPRFSFQVADPQGVVALAAIMTTAIVITGLTAKVRKSSEALRQREQQWREVFEHTPTMYFMLDAAGTVLSVNAFGATQLGYTVDELAGQSVLKVFFAEDREQAKANVATCLETRGQQHQWELRKVRKDGTLLWVRENAKAVRRAGNDVMVLIACEDVTDRKRGAQRLAAQYAVARVLAESDSLASSTLPLLRAIGEKLEWDWGALWTVDGEGRLRCNHIWHAPNLETAVFDAICRDLAIAPGQGRVGQVWQSASPIWIADATKDQGFRRASAAVKAGLHGALAFPILLGKHAFGVVEFFSRAARERDDEQLATLSVIGSQIGQFITRKQAEQALQEGETHFRALIEHGYDVLLLVDAQGIFRYASPSVARMLGYSPEDLVGRDAFDLVHPGQLESTKTRFAQFIAGSDNVPGRNLLRHKDGTWRWTESAGSNLLHEPGVRAIVFNVRDVTERKQAEDALRESEQRFRDYVETASDWLWETRPDHRVTRYDGTGPERDFSRLIGRARWEFATDRDQEPEKWREHLADLEARRPFRGFTYSAARADGSTYYVAVSGRPVFGQDGVFLGYRGTGTDVTAAVRADQAEKALAEARAELAHMARLTALGELSASIAHEINQPLAAVVTDASASLRWLAGQAPNLDEVGHALSRIIKSGHRASEVIGRIRALAKKSPIQAERLDVNETILGVIALMRSELHRNHVLLRTELADDLPLGVADRIQLQQVILNLIMNAIEAMVEGRPRQLVVASGHDRSEHVLVAVRDSGRGLDPEGARRLFEAFYTTKPEGMGMGLAISRSIIEAHGGRLWASANTPRGAVFQFTLPVEKDASADDGSSSPVAGETAQSTDT